MNNAGRIGFLIKGEYDPAAKYDFLDVVFYQKSSYVAKKTTIGNTPVESDEFWQILAKAEGLTDDGDISDTSLTFEQAADRVNVNSGEKMKTFAGKVKKWFADLGAAAFAGIANNDTTTVEGFALDARRGKTLRDDINLLNSALKRTVVRVSQPNTTDIFSFFESFGVSILKSGNVVTIRLNIEGTMKATNIFVTVFIIPEGYRPSISLIGNYVSQKGDPMTFFINDNGSFQLFNGSKDISGYYCRQVITYVI